MDPTDPEHCLIRTFGGSRAVYGSVRNIIRSGSGGPKFYGSDGSGPLLNTGTVPMEDPDPYEIISDLDGHKVMDPMDLMNPEPVFRIRKIFIRIRILRPVSIMMNLDPDPTCSSAIVNEQRLFFQFPNLKKRY